MTYTPTTWVDNVTPVNASNLNKIETELAALDPATPSSSPFVPRDDATAAATRVLANKLLAADAQPAFRVMGDGKIQWGVGGSSAPDTSLYHRGVGDMVLDSALETGGSIFSHQASSTAIGFGVYIGSETNDRWEVVMNGTMRWGSGSAPFDVNLYRYAVDILATDDDFVARLGSSSQVRLGLASNPAGIWLGSASDVNLYRSGADRIATDDTLDLYRGAGAPALRVWWASGDANPGFTIDRNGAMNWGQGGVSSVDTNLYRGGSGILQSDGLILARGLKTGTGSASTNLDQVAIGNSTANTGTPSAGGWLFSEGGALKWKGSSGTVTTIAPA